MFKWIIIIAYFATTTGKLMISPIAAVAGAGALTLRLFFNRTFFALEWALVAFMGYFFISTVIVEPMAIFHVGYYRWDGNFWVSYLPIFAIAFIPWPVVSVNIVRKFILFTFILYGALFIYWIMTKECHFGGWCSFDGLYVARNATGGFLSVVAAISLVIWMQSKEKLFGFIFSGFVVILFFTLSRGSLLVLFGVIIVYWILLSKKWRVDIAILLTLSLASLFFAYKHYNPKYDYKHANITTDTFIQNGDIKTANIAIRREYLWPKSIALIIENPWFGHGVGTFNDTQTDGKRHEYSASHAHNTLLHFLAELGIIGTSFYVAFIVLFRKKWLEMRTKEPLISDLAYIPFLTVLFASFTEHRMTAPASMILVSLMIGSFLSYIRLDSANH